jgi:hypothetical protein
MACTYTMWDALAEQAERIKNGTQRKWLKKHKGKIVTILIKLF